MGKFTLLNYNEKNEKHVKLINDYVFFKYYLKTLKSDWEKFFWENHLEDSYDKPIIYDTVSKHLNKQEFERFKNIYIMLRKVERISECKNGLFVNTEGIFDDIFIYDVSNDKSLIRLYKMYLQDYFNNKYHYFKELHY